MNSISALAIAEKIIAKTNTECGDTISNLKLQKLLYYMQGYHLAFFDTELFSEDIVAWQYGPVVEVVYGYYQQYGKNAINVPENNDNIICLADEQEDLFNSVYKEYNKFSAIELMDMTHDEYPWKTTALKAVISKDKLKDFFKTMIED